MALKSGALFLALVLLTFVQVPFYLVELTERLSNRDRLEIVKTSQAKLKVSLVTW